MLRDPALHEVIADVHNFNGPEGKQHELIIDFMERVPGKKMPRIESCLTFVWTLQNSEILQTVLQTRAWTKYPENPPQIIAADSGELDPDTL